MEARWLTGLEWVYSVAGPCQNIEQRDIQTENMSIFTGQEHFKVAGAAKEGLHNANSSEDSKPSASSRISELLVMKIRRGITQNFKETLS